MFTAAASSIKVKLYNGDGDEDSVSRFFVRTRSILTARRQDTPQPSGSSTPLDRTSTGIISNKPQKVGLSVLTTPATSRVTGLSVMALAKRESARRGLYSRFFRGPVLGPDTEEPQVPDVARRSSPLRSELSDLRCSALITEKKKEKKRKSREEDKETGVALKKRKSKKETRQREKRRLQKEAEISDLSLDGGVETGLTEVPTPPKSSAQGNGVVDHSRKKDRKKKRKRTKESAVPHHG